MTNAIGSKQWMIVKNHTTRNRSIYINACVKCVMTFQQVSLNCENHKMGGECLKCS